MIFLIPCNGYFTPSYVDVEHYVIASLQTLGGNLNFIKIGLVTVMVCKRV